MAWCRLLQHYDYLCDMLSVLPLLTCLAWCRLLQHYNYTPVEANQIPAAAVVVAVAAELAAVGDDLYDMLPVLPLLTLTWQRVVIII